MDLGQQLTQATQSITGEPGGMKPSTAAPAPVPASAPASPEALSPVSGFLESTLWSPLSLIGVSAPPKVQRWQAHHPWGSFASQLAGYAIPYVSWAKEIGRAHV